MTESDDGETDLPREFNEFVTLIENNDAGASAALLERNYMPIDDLRELVEQWREKERTTALRNGGDRYGECADELEQRINEYSGENDE